MTWHDHGLRGYRYDAALKKANYATLAASMEPSGGADDEEDEVCLRMLAFPAIHTPAFGGYQCPLQHRYLLATV